MNVSSTQIWPETRTVSIVVAPSGWFTPFAKNLAEKLNAAGIESKYVGKQEDVADGTIAFYLSCTEITPPKLLKRNLWNVVVHASRLPHGRGFSPLVWQILEGENTIPLTMITMAEDVDSGDILMQRDRTFKGYELNDEIREAIGGDIVDMCFDFATSPTAPAPKPQSGTPSWYRRRNPDDSALDPQKTLAEQFNLLRVADNENYPSFFDLNGHRYILTIERRDLEGGNNGETIVGN